MSKVYCGIGSRQTPPDIMSVMVSAATQLAKAGFTLSTGGADGADSFFEMGAKSGRGDIQLWLPWTRFNGRTEHVARSEPNRLALQKAEQFLGDEHWNRMLASFLKKNGAESIEAYEEACAKARRPSRLRFYNANSKFPFERHYCPAHMLHGRNMHQILGADLRTPVEFVIAWAPVKHGKPVGGTATAINLAEENYITVYNLFLRKRRKQFLDDALPAYLRGERLTQEV